jgi:hypothetical protein
MPMTRRRARGARGGIRAAAAATGVLAPLAALLVAIPAGRALAAPTQESIFEDDTHVLADPVDTLAGLRMLGAERVRVAVRWQLIAPNPSSRRRPHFNASDPGAYPAAKWAVWDTVVRAAKQDGMGLNFDLLGGAPLWATGPGAPKDKPYPSWEPSASEFGSFVRAVATRYSGNYDPVLKRIAPGDPGDLPRVGYWSIWNEPDYGPSLAPQGVPGNLKVENSPRMYRGLLDAGWSALRATGHGHDTVLIGELAPRGESYWGVFSGMKPLTFMRALYCVDSRYHELRGSAAAIRGCPATAAGSRRFRAAHPALFQATGVADHPYMRWYPPNREAQPDPNYSTLGEIRLFERALDHLVRVYGSGTRFPIYDTEFGYITSPPKHRNQYPWLPVATAADYLNWAEYIHWHDPRIESYNQFLLEDPLPALSSNDWGGFASGIETYHGAPKPTYDAWRMPLYLPVTSTRAGHGLEVWGCARPSHYAILDTGLPETLGVQFQPTGGGAFTTVYTATVTRASDCYFDARVAFPASGTVRLAWTYPSLDPGLGNFDPASPRTVYSRSVQITVH